MDRTRVKDWLIGATGMLVVLVAGAAALWWAVTDPPGSGRTEAPTAEPNGPVRTEPPARLRPDEVWLANLVLDTRRIATADSMLRDVRARGRDVVTGPSGLVASRVTVDATVPFEVVAAELGDGAEVRAAEDGQAMVLTSVKALGRELDVAATGTVEVVAGRLVVEPRSIDLGGPGFLSDALAAVVRRLVTIEHEVAGLPEGLVLEDVSVRSDGFRARLRGHDVVLVP